MQRPHITQSEGLPGEREDGKHQRHLTRGVLAKSGAKHCRDSVQRNFSGFLPFSQPCMGTSTVTGVGSGEPVENPIYSKSTH